MAPDVVTAAYRAGAFVSRTLPWGMADAAATALSRAAAGVSRERRLIVSRHLRRVHPELDGRALRRLVNATFRSYARYWVESFRLPEMTVAEIDAGISVENFQYIADAIDAGTGVIVVMPHLGGWEWAGIWTTLVKGYATTVVVEAVEPPSLFEFFASFRRELGLNIVPLGPSAATEILQALAQNHVVCLLADRDIPGDGIELEMFGEVTTIPAGPAMLALRSGAPLITAAVYFTGEHGHRGVVQEPLEVRREGRLRDDVTRVTIEIANRLEELIARAPEQWHLQQPNWPSDYDFLEAIGKPHPRPTSGPASRAPGD